MFEVLAELTESGPSLDDFPKVWAAFERLQALLQRTAARHAVTGEYAVCGFQTMPSWLRHNCGMSHRDASALVTSGRFLNRYPAVGDAVEAGRISAGHATAIRRMVKETIAGIFEDAQSTVVDDVEPLTVAETETYCKRWREHAEAIIDAPEPPAPDKNLSISRGVDGSLLGSFNLDEAGAAQLEAALATAARWDGAGDVRSVGHRNADALVEICAFFNANHDKDGTPRHRTHIELIQHINDLPTEAFGPHGVYCPTCGGCACTRHVDNDRFDTGGSDQSAFADDSLFEPGHDPGPGSSRDRCCGSQQPVSRTGKFRKAGTTIDGQSIPASSMRAFLCDSVISRVMAAPGLKIEYGRETRTVPLALFRIVALRDGGCRYPGCCRKVAWTEAHHLVHWEDGGDTTETNLALFCSRHHHLIHRPGWHAHMDATANITITTPYGQTLTSKPRGPST